MRRPAASPTPALVLALLAVTAGCLGMGAVDAYVLDAERVDDLAAHAAADPAPHDAPVVGAAVRNGTATAVGRRAVSNGSLVAVDGAFYRATATRVGTREVTVPTLRLVPAAGDPDPGLRREALPAVDRDALGPAVQQSEARAEGEGTPPPAGWPYFRGANGSRLLDANGSLIAAFGDTYRVVVAEESVEGPVFEYRTERVAGNESALRERLVREVTLAPAERDVLRSAAERDEAHRAPASAVDAGNQPGLAGLVEDAGMTLPRPGDPPRTAYVAAGDRVYYLELWYERAGS